MTIRCSFYGCTTSPVASEEAARISNFVQNPDGRWFCGHEHMRDAQANIGSIDGGNPADRARLPPPKPPPAPPRMIKCAGVRQDRSGSWHPCETQLAVAPTTTEADLPKLLDAQGWIESDGKTWCGKDCLNRRPGA